MKRTERTGAPAVGNAIGLFVGLWAIDKYDFLPKDQQEYIVVAFGTVFIHLLFEARQIISWVADLIAKRTKAQ